MKYFCAIFFGDILIIANHCFIDSLMHDFIGTVIKHRSGD